MKFICATADNSTSIIISWNTEPDIGLSTAPPTQCQFGVNGLTVTVRRTNFNLVFNTAPNDISTGNSNITKVQLLLQGMELIDNSVNVLFISRQVRKRVIKSSLCVETRPIVGKRVETEYTTVKAGC